MSLTNFHDNYRIMDYHFFSYNHSKLHYAKRGNGAQTMLLFHGYGQDHSVFENIAEVLSPQYTCYLFDLYFHGKSEWAIDERPLEKQEWKMLLQAFLKEKKIDRFSLYGYSMGAKFVLASIEAIPTHIEKVFLVAPDGVKTNFWYALATNNIISRNLFKYIILHPTLYEKIGKILSSLKFVDKSLLRFADYQMNTEAKRSKVYYSWIVLRNLRFDVNTLSSIINDHNIGITIVVGKNDNVVLPTTVDKFRKKLACCSYHLIPAGHVGLIGQSLPYLD